MRFVRNDRTAAGERPGRLHRVAIMEQRAVVGVAAVDILRRGLQRYMVDLKRVAEQCRHWMLAGELHLRGLGQQDRALPGEEIRKRLLVIAEPAVEEFPVFIRRGGRNDRFKCGELRSHRLIECVDRAVLSFHRVPVGVQGTRCRIEPVGRFVPAYEERGIRIVADLPRHGSPEGFQRIPVGPGDADCAGTRGRPERR